jgi:hypothetical protein
MISSSFFCFHCFTSRPLGSSLVVKKSKWRVTVVQRSHVYFGLMKQSRWLLFCKDFIQNSARNHPPRKIVYMWEKSLAERFLCSQQGKGSERLHASAETVKRVWKSFLCSLQKSMYHARQQLQIPKPTIWKMLQQRLSFKPYKLQLLQTLSKNEKLNR